MTNKTLSISLSIFLVFVILALSAKPASALLIKSIDVSDINPGEDTTLTIQVENNLNDDVEQVSLALNLQGLPFNTLGISEDSVDEIQEGDEESFAFRIRSSPTAKPGDYQIPFTLTYQNLSKPQTGTIGIRIKGSVILDATISTETPVLNQKDKLSLKIINKGFADARYVSVTLIPEGFTLNSPDKIYIGDINANDFETASFDIIYTDKNPIVTASIEYLDFNNAKQTKFTTLPIDVYTQEEAIQRGIIQKNNTPIYVGIIIALIIIWLVWRSISKRRRLKKSMQNLSGK